MPKLDLSKLHVKYLPPATDFRPVEQRKYTVTHSDETGDVFLAIGHAYDNNAVNQKFRDELLAEWIPQLGQFVLLGNVYVSGGEYDEKYAKIRYMIFKKEAKLALSAIMHGDSGFLSNYPWLLDAPIYIQFQSIYPEFSQILYFGTPRQYLNRSILENQAQNV